MPTSGHHLNSIFGLVYVILDVLHAVVVTIDLASIVCFWGLLEVRSIWALDHIVLLQTLRTRERVLEG